MRIAIAIAISLAVAMTTARCARDTATAPAPLAPDAEPCSQPVLTAPVQEPASTPAAGDYLLVMKTRKELWQLAVISAQSIFQSQFGGMDRWDVIAIYVPGDHAVLMVADDVMADDIEQSVIFPAYGAYLVLAPSQHDV